MELVNNLSGEELVEAYHQLASNYAVPLADADSFCLLGIELADQLNYSTGQMKCYYLSGHLAFEGANYEAAIPRYVRGQEIAKKVSDFKNVKKGYEFLSNNYYFLQWYDSALSVAKEGRSWCISQPKIDSTFLALMYSSEGLYYMIKSNTRSAVKAYLNAIEILELLGDKDNLARKYADLAVAVERNGNLEDASKYFKLSVKTFEEIDQPVQYEIALTNYSIMYKNAGKVDSALWLLDKGLEQLDYAIETGKLAANRRHEYLFPLLMNQLENNFLKGNDVKAEEILSQIQALSRSKLTEYETANLLHMEAIYFQRKGNYEEARRKSDSAIVMMKKLDIKDDLKDILTDRVKLEREIGAFQQAVEFQAEVLALSDTLNELMLSSLNKELLLEFETEKKQELINNLKEENLKATNRRNILTAGMIIFLILGIAGTIIFRQRIQKEQELLAQERELDQIKGRFFTQLSHELRTPLTLILGPLKQLLARKEKHPDEKELKMMERNANRLLHLVNQVMDLSKLQSGKLELKASPQELKPLMGYIYSSFESRTASKNIDYSLEFEAESIQLFLDEDKFQTIMDNLLSNGCKFVPQNGELTIKVTDHHNKVQIDVMDNGPGLSPLEMEYIFDPYYQVEDHQQTDQAGSGIGLALAKELTELHGGMIKVFSVKGEGSTFQLTFLKGKEHLKPAQIFMGIKSRKEQNSLKDLKEAEEELTVDHEESKENLPLVLIAEDVKDMQSYIYSVLEGKYRIKIADDGADAFEWAKKLIPDVVIADVMMPRMDGMQFAEKLKAHPQTDHIPLIFLSAKSSQEDRNEGWKNEAFSFLSKPFNPQELILVIESALKLQQKMQARFQGKLILSPEEVAVNSQESTFLNKLKAYLEDQIDNSELNVEDLASEMAMSKTQLNRKLKAISGKSPAQFIRAFRLERARQLLKDGYGNVSEVSDAVGFSSVAYFSRIFSEEFNMSPSSWLKTLS
ncbi:MAG: ATP-binding protein [Bacteroidota bacterium]